MKQTMFTVYTALDSKECGHFWKEALWVIDHMGKYKITRNDSSTPDAKHMIAIMMPLKCWHEAITSGWIGANWAGHLQDELLKHDTEDAKELDWPEQHWYCAKPTVIREFGK